MCGSFILTKYLIAYHAAASLTATKYEALYLERKHVVKHDPGDSSKVCHLVFGNISLLNQQQKKKLCDYIHVFVCFVLCCLQVHSVAL